MKKRKRYKREQRKYFFRTSIEVERTYRGSGGKGKRQKRKKPTEEQIARQNQYNREKKLRRIIKVNFGEDDYWVLLTYRKGFRTEIRKAKEGFRKFIRILRREYRKRGYELKWVVRTEVGKQGAAHHHFLCNRIPDEDILIKNCWQKVTGAGFPSFKHTYEEGGFAGLAWYLTKPPDQEGIYEIEKMNGCVATEEQTLEILGNKELDFEVDELRQFTERQQALIDGVEFGIDYGLEVAPEDIEEYHRLTGSSCNMIKEMELKRNEPK